MTLSSIRIKGYRSLQDLNVSVDQYVCLIGANDSGKSSILRSVLLLLDPTVSVSAEDFCSLGEGSTTIEIEGDFTDCPDSIRWATNGRASLRRLFTSANKSEYFYRSSVPTNTVLHNLCAGTATKAELRACAAIPQAMKDRILTLLPKGHPTPADLTECYNVIASEFSIETAPGWAVLSPSQVSSAVDVFFLSADMRASEEATDSSKALFGRLGAELYRKACQNHPGLLEKTRELEQVLAEVSQRDNEGKWRLSSMQKLEDILQEELARFDPLVKVQQIAEIPRLPPPGFPLRLSVDDGTATGLASLGHGLRRSLIFAMLQTLARMAEASDSEEEESTSKLKVFLIEEPELYLHPQAERKRMQDLQRLSSSTNCQVMVCTHSAFFVDISRIRSIVRLERPERKGTVCFTWTGPELEEDAKEQLKYAQAMHPTTSAVLFARLAILIEGETELGSVPPLARDFGLDESGVEVVSCRGSGVARMARVCDQFGVKYVAWLDWDKQAQVAEIDQLPAADLRRIVLLRPDWEGVAGLPRGGNDKPWRSYRKFVIEKCEVPNAIRDAIRAAYEHREFRMGRKGGPK